MRTSIPCMLAMYQSVITARGLLMLLVTTWTLFCQCQYASADEHVDSLCGPRCVQSALAKFGIEKELLEVCRLSGYKKEAGTTLEGLAHAVREIGLHALGVKSRIEDVPLSKAVVIAHLWGDHFVLVDDIQGETIVVSDPSFPRRRYVSKAKWTEMYSGYALIVSKEEIATLPRYSGPDIRFPGGFVHDVGRVDSTRSIRCQFPFENKGDKELVISSVRSCCENVRAGVSRWRIPRGQGGLIEIEANISPDDAGRKSFEILVQTNDPRTPRVVLEIRYSLGSEISAFPPQIIFGDVRIGSVVSQRVVLAGIEEILLSDIVVASSVSGLTWRVCGIGTLWGRRGAVIEAILDAKSPPRQVRGSIRVTIASQNGEELLTEIPVFARIVGDIQPTPEVVFFGIVRHGSRALSTVTLHPRPPAQFTVERVSCDLPFVSVVIRRENDAWVLEATLEETAPAGDVKGTLSVYTDDPDEGKLTIPVHGFVEARVASQ